MFENILYATDFSESPLMLPCIGIIGKTKKIHLLHVIGEGTGIDPKSVDPQMLEAKTFLEETLNDERNKGVEVDVHVMPGVPARGICDIANRVDASLIVVNYHEPEGLTGSATMDLVKNCPRDLLAMTRLSSDAVERSGEAMDQYCTNLFRHVVCPATGDPSRRVNVIEALKREVNLGKVTFSGFSEDASKRAETLVEESKAMGISAEPLIIKESPARSLISAANRVDASLILLDAMSELGLALAVVGASDIPVLILKSV